MKKRIDKIPFVLFGICLFLCWFFVLRQGIFGSKIDWISQHSVFPDYFRQLFYRTGNPFTNFAPQIGGGQNMFHFAYYGLMNPIIILSYLLPFVKMGDYIMWSSMCCYGLSVAFFYLWIREKCNHKATAVGIAGMFALATPLLYHSYNQLMFVNYMPFLCLAFIGTDRYLKQRKSGLLIFGTVGMILTSFYFSIGGMLALTLYATSTYCMRQEKFHFRNYLAWVIPYLVRLGIAVLMCGILLVPTAFALRGDRGQGAQLKLSWFIPNLIPGKLLFSPHGIGLTILSLLALIRGLFYRSWRERLLPIVLTVLFVFPVFGYLLNGGLYNKTKVFIPFLPLCSYLVIPYLNQIREKYGQKISVTLPYLSIFVLFIVNLFIHNNDNIVSNDFYASVTSNQNVAWMKQSVQADELMYRTEEIGDYEENKANINRIRCLEQSISSVYSSAYNDMYADFRNNSFSLDVPYRNNMMQSVTNNPCFLRFMGVKHLVSQEQIPGYSLEKNGSEESIWTSEKAIPVIYSTNHLMTEQQYKMLSFPDIQSSVLQNAVVKENETSGQFQSVFHKSLCSFPIINNNNLSIEAIDDGYEINLNNATEIMLDINKDLNDDLVAVSFQVENLNPNEDMYITMNHQKNLLTANEHEYANENTTFTYLFGVSKVEKQLLVSLGEGNYRIHNIEFFAGSWEDLENTGLCQNAFQPKQKNWTTKWNGRTSIEGTIEAGDESYLITSIPFDEGFTLYVDGEEVEKEVVNTAFLGCKLRKGNHQIIIQYETKGFQTGCLLSFLGICLCGIVMRKKQDK